MVIGLFGLKSLNEDEEILRTPSLKEFVLKKRIWELEHEGTDVKILNTFGSLSLDKYLEVMGKSKEISNKRRGGLNKFS